MTFPDKKSGSHGCHRFAPKVRLLLERCFVSNGDVYCPDAQLLYDSIVASSDYIHSDL